MLHTRATEIANELTGIIKPYCTRIEIAGSVRREKEFVGLGGRILYDECDVYKLQDLTRADERVNALQEIEQRLQSLMPLPNNEFGTKLGTIMLIITKELKQLKTMLDFS